MKIQQEVLVELSKGLVEGREFRLTGQLSRDLYLKTNKVLEAAGGQWNRKAKAHIFEMDAEDRISQIILTGEIEIPRDEFDYFPTPLKVVQRLLDLAEIQPGMRVLEPSAGRGAIALEIAKITKPFCIEINTECFIALRANQGFFADITQGDFLKMFPVPIAPQFDRIVMNPPFSRRNDVKHVLHALKWLKPGGRLVAVMSSGVTFREDSLTRELRSHFSSVEALPEKSFKESGTLVNTVIVVINK